MGSIYVKMEYCGTELKAYYKLHWLIIFGIE